MTGAGKTKDSSQAMLKGGVDPNMRYSRLSDSDRPRSLWRYEDVDGDTFVTCIDMIMSHRINLRYS